MQSRQCAAPQAEPARGETLLLAVARVFWALEAHSVHSRPLLCLCLCLIISFFLADNIDREVVVAVLRSLLLCSRLSSLLLVPHMQAAPVRAEVFCLVKVLCRPPTGRYKLFLRHYWDTVTVSPV